MIYLKEFLARSKTVRESIENPDILGSLEFACKLAGAKVVLVMGHTACGAIKGAIDNAELRNLTGLLAKIKPAVEATTYSGERSAKNYAFVDAVARKNVEMTVANIRKDSSVLAELEAIGDSSMVLIRRLVIVAAISLFGTSANALSMQECRAQYKADHADRGKERISWADYQAKRCGINPKANTPTPRAAAPMKH